eukprot:TRINITY_DN13895_c0_g1_i1.p1 TRINITY_DN13895_c0_g1~~TRINITY_DN13895_c0_g1_i1.p1  ORF type:complete len:393 (+),score=116.24 TRINITY_DN13895_c0_g1_i1:76-1179(+)
MLEAIRFNKEQNELQLLDQTLLPLEFKYVTINGSEDGWSAIRTMKVRGAPAIAISAALSLAVEVKKALDAAKFDTADGAATFIGEKLDYLTTSRPTAVNLFEAAARLKKRAQDLAQTSGATATSVADDFISQAELMLNVDLEANKAMGNYGAVHISSGDKKSGLNVLTHCNTGSLATAGYGTALGVIRSLFGKNLLEHAYCTETRPYNQGARLTALELVYEKIPATLVTDSMAGFLMQKGKVDAVVVGADRVAANGDTANKIGTYALAVLCKHHGIPFYVAAPTTTLDANLPDGSHIVIEERPPKELTHVAGVQLAPDGIGVWNPAFDVTPHHLIAGIFTERGVITKPDEKSPFDIPSFLKQTASSS